jgi:hypothetical protein
MLEEFLDPDQINEAALVDLNGNILTRWSQSQTFDTPS